MKFKLFLPILFIIFGISLNAESTPDAKKNYVDLKLGVARFEGTNQPLVSLSYERIWKESFLFGIVASYSPLREERDKGFLRSEELNAASGTLSFGYQWYVGTSLRPYARILAGAGRIAGFSEELQFWQYGLGVGSRYMFTESLYGNLEIAGSRFQAREESRAYSDVPQVTLGIGILF